MTTRRTSARRSSRKLRSNAETRIRLGDKVRWGGDVWNVDDIQAYDHLRGGAPKTLVLRRTVITDPTKRYKDEAVFKRNVPVTEVEQVQGDLRRNGPDRRSSKRLTTGSPEAEKAIRQAGHVLMFDGGAEAVTAHNIAAKTGLPVAYIREVCERSFFTTLSDNKLRPNAPDRYLLVRDLPRSLQAALREVEYGKKDIEVKAREMFDPSAAGGSGRRGFVAACKMDDSGNYEIEWGSWGGENPFTRTVEGYQGEIPIPPEVAFIRGSIGGGIPTMASVYVSPHAMNPALLTAGPEVTPKEAKILAIFKQLKSSYRPEYLDRLQEKEGIEGSRARQATTDREVDSLIERGFLSRNKAGSVSITTGGRNAADPRQP